MTVRIWFGYWIALIEIFLLIWKLSKDWVTLAPAIHGPGPIGSGSTILVRGSLLSIWPTPWTVARILSRILVAVKGHWVRMINNCKANDWFNIQYSVNKFIHFFIINIDRNYNKGSVYIFDWSNWIQKHFQEIFSVMDYLELFQRHNLVVIFLNVGDRFYPGHQHPILLPTD